ncbi:hypothetical protein HanPI659440_Chr13g0510351 [Helianthus annuus]|nr:hypothetical protein HanPI659440_Chr13g0510351 [Helianthus annuus]
MSDLSDALQNLNLYPVRTEVSRDFNRYIPDIEEPREFNALPKPKKMEIRESSRQIERLPSQEELDFILASYNTIKPVNENVFIHSLETQLPINLESAILNPSIHSQPFRMDEWLTNEIQLQNNPYKLFLQFNLEPLPNPPISNKNMAELRHFGQELMDTGNRIQEIGGQICWKYDERKRRY